MILKDFPNSRCESTRDTPSLKRIGRKSCDESVRLALWVCGRQTGIGEQRKGWDTFGRALKSSFRAMRTGSKCTIL